MTGWGVLGTGLIAHHQTRDLIAAGSRVSAVGSRSTQTAQAFAAEFDIPRAHGDYRSLVEDPDVDIVYIATPPTRHEADATLAINAGKHVMLEKPFTVDAASAERIVERARERGVVLMEAMWSRFLPHMIRIRELLDEHALGEPRMLIADVGQQLPADPEFRLNRRDLAGGSLLDIGVYPVQFALSVFGMPTRIQVASALSATGVDRQTSVLCEFETGAHSISHSALDARGPNRASLIGTEGRIDIGSTWYAPASWSRFDASGELVEQFDNTVTPRGMQYQAAEMEHLVATGTLESPRMTHTDTLNVMRVLDEIRRLGGIDLPTE